MAGTFSDIYKAFLSDQQKGHQDAFKSACHTWLTFESTQTQATRLSILYILHAHFSPLEENPFLTFFLELTDLKQPFSAIEQHFVYCILEDSLASLDNVTPEEVCSDPNNKLPAVRKSQGHIDLLKQKVARLIDNPDLVIIDEGVTTLLSDACQRVLTLSESEKIRRERLSSYPVQNYVIPDHVCQLINLNQFLALDIVPLVLRTEQSNLYLEALLNSRVTIQSIEVVHHILMNNTFLPQEFLHYYISNSIRSCDQLEEGIARDRQVKQVSRFIQSLLEKQIIPMRDYFVEIQSFCISYMKLKGVANLFRLASQEAAQQHLYQ